MHAAALPCTREHAVLRCGIVVHSVSFAANRAAVIGRTMHQPRT
jgi:hypothetical protein